MAIVRRNAWVVVPTKSGGETTAVVRKDTRVKVERGRKRIALERLDVYKANTQSGREGWWSLPEGTEFRFISNTKAR